MSTDTLFTQAALAVVKQQQCSLSFVALELGVAATRAAILLADLQVAGVVSAFDPDKGREVLLKDVPALEAHLKTLV